MPVEPGLVDTNVLVYALDADAAQHASSRALLEAGRAASVTLYVTSQIICEFYSVVTNPRRVANPCSPAAALAAISSLLGFLRVLPVPAHTVEELIRLLRRRPVTGGDIFDLQILATMNVNGIPRIYTFNTADFASFPDIAPLTPQIPVRCRQHWIEKEILENYRIRIQVSSLTGGVTRSPFRSQVLIYSESTTMFPYALFLILEVRPQWLCTLIQSGSRRKSGPPVTKLLSHGSSNHFHQSERSKRSLLDIVSGHDVMHYTAKLNPRRL